MINIIEKRKKKKEKRKKKKEKRKKNKKKRNIHKSGKFQEIKIRFNTYISHHKHVDRV